MLMIKNKRGDVSIVILVLLVLVTASATLLSFATSSGKVEGKISDAQIITDVHLKENIVKFYINQAGERTIIQTYKEIIENDNYIGGAVKYINNVDVEFAVLNNNLNENFKSRFTKYFKEEFGKYDFDEDYLKNLKEVVLSEDFEVLFDGKSLQTVFVNFEFKNSFRDINVTYTPKIILDFDLDKIGLDSFEKIYEVKEACKSQEDVEGCFNNGLVNFEVTVNEKTKTSGEKYNIVTLDSKKEFLINKEFKKISFSFVPV